jgi:hypothetical protein
MVESDSYSTSYGKMNYFKNRAGGMKYRSYYEISDFLAKVPVTGRGEAGYGLRIYGRPERQPVG